MKNTFTCNYPCSDVIHNLIYPKKNLDADKIEIILISEAPTENPTDYYYMRESGAFFKTTQIAFNDAGISINSYNDLTNMGIYLTTAIKCPKTDYLVSSKTIKECSLRILKKEIELFPNIKVIMCMGDFAIKAINYIYKNTYNTQPIKAGSTYKIRKEKHIFNNIRFIPSYTQTGNSFNIEKSKRKMIAEDIKTALKFIKS